MSNLACNIVAYRPDREMLVANFRHWHVEAHLDQASTLIDRCREDYKEYCSLQYAWHEFTHLLETQVRQLEFDKSESAGLPETETAEVPEPLSLSEESQESLEGAAGTLPESEEQVVPTVREVPRQRTRLDLQAEAVRRKKELSAPGGPFALDERRDLALKRLCRDYEEAVNRACVAEAGLKVFYDHAEPSSPLPPEDEALGVSISNLTNWIRNAGEWLVRYRQMEEAFTRVISLRSLLTRNAWVQVKQSRDSYSSKLQIPINLFRDYDNCRLRGVGAAIIGDAGKVPWSMTLQLPEQALYHRSGQSVNVNQFGRPPCLLGRVENRRSIHPIEICGATSWMNASPIGRPTPGGLWSLDIFKPVGANSESFGHVEDVVLEIYVVGTPKMEG